MNSNYEVNRDILANGRANVRDSFSYDYLTVETNEKYVIDYVDCYEAFGWEIVKNERGIALKTILTFKRNRKIKNKDILNKIQVKLDERLKQINVLEEKKTTTAMGVSIGLGIVGSLTFGGGLCLCLLNATVSAIIGGIVLGVVGMTISGLGFIYYNKIKAKKTAQLNPLIDHKRDEISSLCEEAQIYLELRP